MPSRSETPAAQRFPLVLPVSCRPKSKGGAARPRAQTGETTDVGEHGLGLRLPICLDQGTLVELTLRTAEEPIHLSGKVIWSRSGPSPPFAHGLVVTPDKPKDLQAWERLLFDLTRHPPEQPARLAVTVPLSCQTVAGPLEGTARNVSREGVCLLLPRTLAGGEELVLLIPHGPGLLEVNGRVAWAEEEPDADGLAAHGIALLDREAGQAVMEALLQAHHRRAASSP